MTEQTPSPLTTEQEYHNHELQRMAQYGFLEYEISVSGAICPLCKQTMECRGWITSATDSRDVTSGTIGVLCMCRPCNKKFHFITAEVYSELSSKQV
jgi:hypothetical protein